MAGVAVADDPALTALLRRVRQAWRPAPRLSLADWADQKFILPEGDANAGRWRTLPYQRAILDVMSDPAIERVTIMKSARVGYTRMFCACVGYYIEHDPCPILVVQPTLDDAKKHSKGDLAPMFRDIPELRALVAEPKAKDSENTILEKLFRGGSLTMTGANSPRGFRRMGIRVVIFDEVDGYPASAGTEGDQIRLGIMRSEFYWNRKILAGSTPTLTGHSRIERMFEEGDQRRYYVPCPHCGAYQVLRFPNLKWPEGHPEAAAFQCTENACRIEPRHKSDMLARGEWRAEAPANFLQPSGRGHASFHVWAGYSASPHASWPQLAAEFIRAVAGGATTHQTFVNTVLGETWRAQGEAPEWTGLLKRREAYPIGTCPAGVCFLTAGVDVQKDRLCYEVVGWGRDKHSWSIDYVTVPGDTADLGPTGPWPALDALLSREYPHALGATLPVDLVAVDAGYNQSIVQAWAQPYSFTRVLVVRGQPSGHAGITGPVLVDVTIRGKRQKSGGRLWNVGGHVFKSELYGLLRLEDPTARGYCHFPEYGPDYFRELTAEQLITVLSRKGYRKLEWVLIPGRRNEALDARVYARAAASVVGIDRWTPSDWAAKEAALTAPVVTYDDERP